MNNTTVEYLTKLESDILNSPNHTKYLWAQVQRVIHYISGFHLMEDYKDEVGNQPPDWEPINPLFRIYDGLCGYPNFSSYVGIITFLYSISEQLVKRYPDKEELFEVLAYDADLGITKEQLEVTNGNSFDVPFSFKYAVSTWNAKLALESLKFSKIVN